MAIFVIEDTTMTTTITHLTVKDFEAWREVFNELHDVRRHFGCFEERIFHKVDDRNQVTIQMEWETPDGARAYTQSPEFKSVSPEDAGWVSPPVFYFLEDAE
jgi:heme-degrading monooxygenase HmoA